MRAGLIAAMVGGLALAGCAAYPYGYGGYSPYGYGYGYAPGYYAAPAVVGYGGGYYAQPYAYNNYWRGRDWNHGNWNQGNWNQGGWHGGGWNGGGWHGGNVYSRSSQPAQRAATPQTRSFEHAMGFVPNP